MWERVIAPDHRCELPSVDECKGIGAGPGSVWVCGNGEASSDGCGARWRITEDEIADGFGGELWTIHDENADPNAQNAGDPFVEAFMADHNQRHVHATLETPLYPVPSLQAPEPAELESGAYYPPRRWWQKPW